MRLTDSPTLLGEVMNQNKLDYLIEEYPEKTFRYYPIQKRYYKSGDSKCIYPQWGKKNSIRKAGGNFPAMVARYHFEKAGYKVVDDYCLIRKPNQRSENAGYNLLCKIFGPTTVHEVICLSEALLCTKDVRRGGDPDLFVYKTDFSDCFFVEAKEPPDKLRISQKIVMYFIRNLMCPVYIAKIVKDSKAASEATSKHNVALSNKLKSEPLSARERRP